MNNRAQTICVWTAPVFALLMLIAFLSFPGFFPPMSPQWSARQVAEFYGQHTGMIRFSMIAFNLLEVMLVPFFAVITVQIKRMATPSHVLAYAYLTAMVSGVTLFAMADIFWLVAAFRPERGPDLIQLLNDLAWMSFTAPVGTVVVQNLCLALAVRFDSRTAPIFPRWVAPFSVATAVAMIPAAAAAVVRTGPLAWDGAVSFWLRLSAQGLFVLVMFAVLLRTVDRQREDERPQWITPEVVS